jgi:hypothetical protein
MWTLDELVERVGLALAAEYSGAPNGRVRDLPDRRAIRWYTTTGLVDRPIGMRGRIALYGPRHLLQLVALKRRQAEGRTLAEIQAELAGATDEALAQVARVPAKLLVADGPQPDQKQGAARTRFWASPAVVPATATVSRRADTSSTAAPTMTGPAADGAALADNAPPHPDQATPVGGVALPGGVILVVPGRPTAADRAAIAAAAQPLLHLLADRGLLNTDDGSPS